VITAIRNVYTAGLLSRFNVLFSLRVIRIELT